MPPDLLRLRSGASQGSSICFGVTCWPKPVPPLAHGLGHGPIGALVSAWPALALADSFELLMTLIRTGKAVSAEPGSAALVRGPGCAISADVPAALPQAPDLEQTIRDWHGAGYSQRAIARELNIDRRKVKRAITSGLT